MTYPGQAPQAFIPPTPPAAPAKPARAGGLLLLLAGLAGIGAIWLPWVVGAGEKYSLKQFTDLMEGLYVSGSVLDNPKVWFYTVAVGGAAAILFGLIGLAGSKGANLMAGIFGLLSAVSIAFTPVWLLVGDGLPDLGEVLDVLGYGYYITVGAAVLALVGAIVGFAGSARK